MPAPSNLAKAIRNFCQSNTPERERFLSPLLDQIFAEADASWIEPLVLPKNQAVLQDAVDQALKVPVTDLDGQTLAEWSGNYTLVQLGLEGVVLAAVRNPVGQAYEVYGDDLYASALAKAIQAIHLAKSHRAADNSFESSARYLETLLKEPHVAYLGAYRDYGAATVIGASGCEVPYSHRLAYTPDTRHEDARQQVDHLAGPFDQIFARLVSNCINSDVSVCREPTFLRGLRYRP